MKASTIFLTRTGFLFQDKFSIYLLLLHLQQRDLKEFYIDYPLDDQKSLDVRLITKDNIEKVYEIKSGTKLKTSEDDVLDAMIDLYKYRKKSGNANLHLIISHGFKPAISHIWDTLVTLKEYKVLSSEKSKNLALDLQKKINHREKLFPTIKDLHSFILGINLEDPFSDDNTKKSETDPLIELTIIQQIDKLSTTLKADSRTSEQASDNLFHKFVFLCCSNAGNGKNLLPTFVNALIDHIVMKQLFSKYYNRPGSLEQKKIDLEKDSRKDFYEWWNQELVGEANSSAIKTEYE